MVRRLYTHTLVAGALALLGERSLHAYPTPVDFSGNLLRWDIKDNAEIITYEVTGNDAAMYSSTVDDAASLWSNVPTSYFTLQNYQDSDQSESAHITIQLGGTYEGSSVSSGYAVFDEVDSNGRPIHCEIKADTSQADLDKTILHEIGHCVGLGHSLIPQAIMSYRVSKNSFSLDTDDQAALSRLYPIDGSDPKLPPGCAVASAKRSAHFPILLLLLLPILCALPKRKERRV